MYFVFVCIVGYCVHVIWQVGFVFCFDLVAAHFKQIFVVTDAGSAFYLYQIPIAVVVFEFNVVAQCVINLFFCCDVFCIAR